MSEQEMNLSEAEILSQEEPDYLVELTDEEGNPAHFKLLDIIRYQGKEYIVLLPAEEDSSEVVILEIQPIPGSEDEEAYVTVEREDILSDVFEMFKERFQDVFIFED